MEFEVVMIDKSKVLINLEMSLSNLSLISGIDMGRPPRLGVIHGITFVLDGDDFPMESVQWLSGEGAEPILDILDRSYWAIHHHLISLRDNPKTDWESKRVEEGVAAIMTLVGESARKIDLYLAFRLGHVLATKVVDREEFRSLQKFYLQHIRSKFSNGIEGDLAWSEEWLENKEAPASAVCGLKDFETVRKDGEYELFYLRNEDGKPYFNPALLRNIKLTVEMESLSDTFEEDPLLQVRSMLDRDSQASANQILGESHAQWILFFKMSKKFVGHELAQALGKVATALFLAANHRNLLQHTSLKNCLQYFDDFIFFLRAALKTSEYQKWVAYPPDSSDKVALLLLELTHSLCSSLFLRAGGIKQEAIGLIHRTMRKGEEMSQAMEKHLAKAESVWGQFFLDDERLRALLSHFPNGSLFKILDIVRESQDENAVVSFDPIAQGNLPSRLYRIDWGEKKMQAMHLPAPICQSVINKVEIVDEFRAFLRRYKDLSKKHFLINLQDRTSWREFSRSKKLETLQHNAEYTKSYASITLSKDTDFYHQANEYALLNQAEDFISALKAQIASEAECGYYFPPSWNPSERFAFVEDAIRLIHAQFFHNKKELHRKDREDFIEIFYQLLVLKALEHYSPDSMSFTCKDALDVGSAASAIFYGFIKMLTEETSMKEERDFFLWLFYVPALLVRERAADPERIHRALSVLDRMHERFKTDRKEILAQLKTIFKALERLRTSH